MCILGESVSLSVFTYRVHSLCLSVFDHKLADAQFFRADAQFFAAGLL